MRNFTFAGTNLHWRIIFSWIFAERQEIANSNSKSPTRQKLEHTGPYWEETSTNSLCVLKGGGVYENVQRQGICHMGTAHGCKTTLCTLPDWLFHSLLWRTVCSVLPSSKTNTTCITAGLLFFFSLSFSVPEVLLSSARSEGSKGMDVPHLFFLFVCCFCFHFRRRHISRVSVCAAAWKTGWTRVGRSWKRSFCRFTLKKCWIA